MSPNDKLIATGSQDRLAKLWSCPDCSLLGVFTGHKRGIWCVQFSPVDQILATSSADGTLKLWGLQDFSCLKVTTAQTAPCSRQLSHATEIDWLIFEFTYLGFGSKYYSLERGSSLKTWQQLEYFGVYFLFSRPLKVTMPLYWRSFL